MLTDVVIANKSYTKLTITDKSGLDQTALKVMNQDCPDFLLPIRTMEVDGELELRYELLEGIRLSYSSPEMSKKDFVMLLKNMLTPFKICSDWFLDYHNILLDSNYVMIGRNGMNVRYIYIPARQYAHTDKEIMDFFSDFIIRAEVMDDPRFVTNLLRVMKREEANLMTILDYLVQEKEPGGQDRDAVQSMGQPLGRETDRNVAPVRQEYPASENRGAQERQSIAKPGGFGERKQEPAAAEEPPVRGGGAKPGQPSAGFGTDDTTGKLLGSLFGDDDEEDEKEKNKQKKGFFAGNKAKKDGKEGGGLFGKRKPSQKNEMGRETEAVRETGDHTANYQAGNAAAQNVFPSQAGNMPFYGDDRTEISVDEDNVSDPNVFRLRLENNGGRDDSPMMIEVDLSRGYATVGRYDKTGHGQADFNFDASFTFVSRRHFRVEKAQEGWRIIDLESANGTFLNGQALAPNIPYPLNSGDRIMISQKYRLTYRVG